MNGCKIAIGSDHTGVGYKHLIIDFLVNRGYYIKDFGFSSYGKKVDYPDFIHPTVKSVDKGEMDFGIVICGSGNGAAMIANKYQKIRAALVWNKKVAFLARRHNNANVLSLPARFVESKKDVLEIIEMFLKTDFEGGRHRRRIEKIPIK